MKPLVLAMVATAAAVGGCTCDAGRTLEPGMVRYGTNSDRETIVKVQSENSDRCSALWIAATEVHPAGGPYQFHLQRIKLRPRRIDGCGASTAGFVRRNKNYRFVFDAHSTSIQEMRAVTPAGADDAQGQSNRNLWSAIVVDRSDRRRARDPAPLDPTRELHRTAWVMARRKIRGNFVGRVRDAGQSEKLVALSKTRIIEAGQLGQIEAVGEKSVIVRFYEGSRVEAFGAKRNVLRRWYGAIGGPYSEVKDDLYSAIRAEILEVATGDVVEVNDYLDEKNADRT